jgi:DNA-binding phage protein
MAEEPAKRSAEEFLDRLEKDKDLQASIRRHVSAVEGIVEVARREGFTFTADELDGALLKKWGDSLFKTIRTIVTFSEAPGF